MSVVIETTLGDITVDLFVDERPIACLNFIKLCKLKYYNFNLFHTIEQGFIAQTGDPTGAGDGGSSVWGVVEGTHKRFFEAESLPKIYHSTPGLLSLVSAGKNLVGSQFFFTLGSELTSLDGIHSVIGEVVEGHEILRQLNEAIVDENFRPYQDIRITHTVILDDPFPNPRGFQVPSRSPSPTAERLKNGRIAADEEIDDTDGKTMEEIQEMLAEREAKARATILEIVGDLPDAEMAPPENVLFVCKLNPVTTDDDLEIIFSRFGKVKTCEVIRDKQSGDSLQYAFVEFEDQKSCEAAYFKMNNVLIDDRRIHVDFSQSVAKVKWRGKGRGVDVESDDIDFNNLRDNNDRNRNRRNDKHDRQQRAGDNNGKHDARTSPSMTSEERRQAREERHRLQREKEGKERNRSRSRSRSREWQRYDRRSPRRYENRYGGGGGGGNYNNRDRRQLNRNNRSPYRRQNVQNSREYNRYPQKRWSPDRSRDKRYSPERRSSKERRRSPYQSYRNESQKISNSETKRYSDAKREPEDYNKKELSQHKKIEKKEKRKKSKRTSSSTESETSARGASTDPSSDSSDSGSSAESTSSEERHKKKKKKSKGKQSKTKKSKSSKKSKKHKK